MSREEADRDGRWATVTLTECSVGKGWYMHRIVGVTRWSDRDRALERAHNWASAGRRAAVIQWGDDLKEGASPERASVPRLIDALALAAHAPLFEADGPGPDAMPTGRLVGCSCGQFNGASEWSEGGEERYADHIRSVFPPPITVVAARRDP